MQRRRVRRRSHWKWMIPVLVLLFLVGLFFASYQYVQYINKDERVKEAEIVKRANEAVKLVSVTEVEKGVWDQVVYTVRGTDEQGHEHIIGVLPDKVNPMTTAEITPKETIEGRIEAQYPDADVIRITPAYKDDQYLWQALVKRKDDQGVVHYFYHFYTFANGSPTGDIYTLPNK